MAERIFLGVCTSCGVGIIHCWVGGGRCFATCLGVGFGGFSFTLVSGYVSDVFYLGGFMCFLGFVGWGGCLLFAGLVAVAFWVFGVNLCVVLFAGWFPGAFGSCGLAQYTAEVGGGCCFATCLRVWFRWVFLPLGE